VDPPRPAVVYGLLSLAVGVGCSRGVTAGEIIELVQAALAEAGLTAASVAAMASVDAKRDEDGLLEAAAHLGWPLHLHPAGELTRVQVRRPPSAPTAPPASPRPPRWPRRPAWAGPTAITGPLPAGDRDRSAIPDPSRRSAG
jgi:cobalt-precorrin 5A hydrolase/precorrin-3B C17-methyltransferase